MKIISICFNWYSTRENGESFTQEFVGKNGVVDIEEHQSKWEGDRQYYTINYDDGTKIIVFNPNSLTLK